MPDICVIVPTVRNPECIEAYIENARSHGFDVDRLHVVLVTEDFCDVDAMEQMLDDLDVSGDVFDASRRTQWFEDHDVAEYADVVPANSHAETSFGLLYMLTRPEFTYGVFLDDDTAPHEDVDFFQAHMDRLEDTHTVPHVSSDEQWVNVLYQHVDEHGLYPRGYPYSCMDESVETETRESAPVVVNQGLWTNIPDLDAVRILMDGDLEGQAQTLTSTEDFDEDFVADTDQFLTVCSMNLSFTRDVIPAFYQFPMDDNEWEIGRFDDIWSGLTVKKAADMLDRAVLTGDPLCIHNKAPRSTFSDLNNEVPALELNEHFWEALDQAPDDADDYYDAYEAMIAAVKDYDFSDCANADFIPYTVEYMERWLELCRILDPDRSA